MSGGLRGHLIGIRIEGDLLDWCPVSGVAGPAFGMTLPRGIPDLLTSGEDLDVLAVVSGGRRDEANGAVVVDVVVPTVAARLPVLREAVGEPTRFP
jgi:hypothetical protein